MGKKQRGTMSPIWMAKKNGCRMPEPDADIEVVVWKTTLNFPRECAC
jgi:hypothetical protein